MKSILIITLCLVGSNDALADVFRKFDEYADLPFPEEKARLDNLADVLRREPDLVAWYMVFAGTKSCEGEVRLRAIRAKNYLVKKYGIRADRIIWADEGYLDNLLVEIWLMPRSVGKPNTTHQSEWTKEYVLRNFKSNCYKRQRRTKL